MTIHESLYRRDFLKTTTQTTAGCAVSASIGSAITPLADCVNDALRPQTSRISYCCDGQIYFSEPGSPEGKPLTTGLTDFKPSWSMKNNMLVCSAERRTIR